MAGNPGLMCWYARAATVAARSDSPSMWRGNRGGRTGCLKLRPKSAERMPRGCLIQDQIPRKYDYCPIIGRASYEMPSEVDLRKVSRRSHRMSLTATHTVTPSGNRLMEASQHSQSAVQKSKMSG
ncbi:hypothetical protein V499_04179 [Pseudogymnoascus sp. VKM F-103]|nr:hypothetical protein V499_04179 [Pseudogymnoascus sp. VKM F-103]